jgi:hypothetical protein
MKLIQAIQETEIILRGAPAIFLALFVFSIFIVSAWTIFSWVMHKIN